MLFKILKHGKKYFGSSRDNNQFTISELGDTFRAFNDSLGDVVGSRKRIMGSDLIAKKCAKFASS